MEMPKPGEWAAKPADLQNEIAPCFYKKRKTKRPYRDDDNSEGDGDDERCYSAFSGQGRHPEAGPGQEGGHRKVPWKRQIPADIIKVHVDDEGNLTVELPVGHEGKGKDTEGRPTVMLSVKGHEAEKGDLETHGERLSGFMSRTLRLPKDADPGKTQSRYQDGVLVITIGKREEDDKHAAAAALPGRPDGGASGHSDYVPAASFVGARPGFVFQKGPLGLGYYRDGSQGQRGGGHIDYVPAASFVGVRPGFVFQKGPLGLGYYRDGSQAQRGDGRDDYVPAAGFGCARPGFVFQKGPLGLGYYRNGSQAQRGDSGAGGAGVVGGSSAAAAN